MLLGGARVTLWRECKLIKSARKKSGEVFEFFAAAEIDGFRRGARNHTRSAKHAHRSSSSSLAKVDELLDRQLDALFCELIYV